MVKKGLEIDELDKEILSILSKNSTIGYTKIAEKLKRSHTTIKKRIDRLERDKIIKNYTIGIDYEKIGYDIIAAIEINVSKGNLLEFDNKIAQHPNVFGVYDVTGEYDSLVLVRFKTRKELSNFIKTMLKSEFVIQTNTHLVFDIIKDHTEFDKIISFVPENMDDFLLDIKVEEQFKEYNK